MFAVYSGREWKPHERSLFGTQDGTIELSDVETKEVSRAKRRRDTLMHNGFVAAADVKATQRSAQRDVGWPPAQLWGPLVSKIAPRAGILPAVPSSALVKLQGGAVQPVALH